MTEQWHDEWGRVMQRMFLIVATLLLTNFAAYAQSLGDVARANSEKKAEDASAAQPRVITNKDLPEDPDTDQATSELQPTTTEPTNKAADHRSAQQRLAEQRAAEQWKRQILTQTNKVAALQARIDELNASIQSAHGSVQSEGPYNRYQMRQLQRVARIQQQLDEQKSQLDQMQETARHAGMHSAVYDP